MKKLLIVALLLLGIPTVASAQSDSNKYLLIGGNYPLYVETNEAMECRFIVTAWEIDEWPKIPFEKMQPMRSTSDGLVHGTILDKSIKGNPLPTVVVKCKEKRK